MIDDAISVAWINIICTGESVGAGNPDLNWGLWMVDLAGFYCF